MQRSEPLVELLATDITCEFRVVFSQAMVEMPRTVATGRSSSKDGLTATGSTAFGVTF
jgi:hypothetical protein